MKTILISALILFTSIQFAQAQNFDEIQFAAELEEKQDSRTPGLCYKQTPKCSYRQLTPAEIDTATAMADEVAFQLKKIDQLERNKNRDFKVAIIGRSGTDLAQFQVLKDAGTDGKLLNMDQLVARMQQQTELKSHQSNSNQQIESGPRISKDVVKSWYDQKRKMEYSHVAIALKNHPKSDKSYHWQVMHLLWTCDKDPARQVTEGDRSYIWEEGFGAVFADDMKQYKAQILVPKQQIQDRIERILLKDKIGAQWHNKKYNAAALADDLDQQNSNQWVLEVLAASTRPVGEVKDRAQAQKILAQTQYLPTKVRPTGLYSLIKIPIISKFLPGTVCMKRQKYFGKGFGEIISVLSLEEYMKRNHMLQYEPFIVQLPDEFNFVKQEQKKP